MKAVGMLQEMNRLAENTLAAGYEKQGRLDLAMNHYREALRINPGFSSARYNLGKALIEVGRTAEALQYYRRALETSPGNPGLLCNLGVAMVKSGQVEEAVAVFKGILRMEPGFALAHYNLGIIYERKGLLKGSKTLLRRCAPAGPCVRPGPQG